jgi:hypothetical protein
MDAKDFIEHVGVKGMKWGVRKKPDPNRSASKWKERKDKERAAKEKASGKKAGGGKDKDKKVEPVGFKEDFTGPVKTVRGELEVRDGRTPKAGDRIKGKDSEGKDRELLVKEVERVGGADNRYRVKAVRPMTDVELRNEVARMQVEKQYKELVAANTPPPQLSRGQKFAREAGKVGINVVTKAVTDVGTQVVKSELQKALGVSASGRKVSTPTPAPTQAGKPKITTWKAPKPRPTPAGTPKTLGKVWKP